MCFFEPVKLVVDLQGQSDHPLTHKAGFPGVTQSVLLSGSRTLQSRSSWWRGKKIVYRITRWGHGLSMAAPKTCTAWCSLTMCFRVYTWLPPLPPPLPAPLFLLRHWRRRLRLLTVLVGDYSQGYKDFCFVLPVALKCSLGFVLVRFPFTCKQHITNTTSLVINDSHLNYEHVVQWTQALTYPSSPTHTPDIPTNIGSSVQTGTRFLRYQLTIQAHPLVNE